MSIPPSLKKGAETISRAIKNMPSSPGVYRMVSLEGKVLYVGKAKNLPKRVVSYTRVTQLPNRLQQMVAQTAAVEIVTTHTEHEALLLEINLIKQYRPLYNILFRDDKSFPWLHLTDHVWPRLTKHRGGRGNKGTSFGPFTSGEALHSVYITLQKVFRLRSCSDTVFSHRLRPCLLYDIKRCSAPCVHRITPEEYQDLVKQAIAFLRGKSGDVQHLLANQMMAASKTLNYEKAAILRDRLQALNRIQAQQNIFTSAVSDADIVAAYQEKGRVAIEVFFYRQGAHYGNAAYFPKHEEGHTVQEVLAAFLGHFYTEHTPPPLILASHSLPEEALLKAALSQQAGYGVKIQTPQRGAKLELIVQAINNARQALRKHQNEQVQQAEVWDYLQQIFEIPLPLQRIEVYDNSHLFGAQAVGAMIVADARGFVKSAYRKFNIRTLGATNDDYAMMREVFLRRFKEVKAKGEKAVEEGETSLPQLVLVDGGAGQVNVVVRVLEELGVPDIAVVGIAKGPDRHAGREKFFLPGKEPLTLPFDHPALYYVQRLRDEAHRFAVGTHRSKRLKQIEKSKIDDIQGIGSSRKKALLRHFGSAHGIESAGVKELQNVPGISRALAQKVYDYFHSKS